MVARGAEGEPKLTATEARQGMWGRPVFVVLVVSTALACVAIAIAYLGVWPH